MTHMLVLGAYGLIGAAVARRLRRDGYAVTGLGRNAATAWRVLPELDWAIHDLTDLCDPDAWRPLLKDVDFVVNCAGALQQGGRDDLDAVHHAAIAAMARACAETGTGIIQISATGAREDASTAFLRTKAAGDGAMRASGAPHWIIRPGMVLAPTAYGGSALLRMLAAVPVIQPLAMPEARIQTVAVSHVAEAVSLAVAGKIPPGTECDLVEDTPHTLREVVVAHRRWLGFAPARRDIVMPGFAVGIARCIADGLGRLGWRPPLRSSAIQVLSEGVTGTPPPGGIPAPTMAETLAAMPARAEDRQAARMALLMPLVIGTLFIFWLASGIIGLIEIESAAQVLENAGWPHGLALASVGFWAVVDIAIAVALMVRKTAPLACWAMVIVSVIYLLSATLVTPQMWADPLGPLVKVLPSIVLALVARAMLETR